MNHAILRWLSLRDIEHELWAQRSRRAHAPKRIRLGRIRRNWCPECKAYTSHNHTHPGGAAKAASIALEAE
jgi:hypothetical protein